SGAGKSTLIRTINRMHDVTSGKLTVDGVDVMSLSGKTLRRFRRKIGMIFQKPNPFPMSIRDNITYGPRIQGIRDRKELNTIVEDCLSKAALYDEVADRLDKSALGLSGGQQQRLCIARTLSVNPEVILMDEPTSALDPIATSKIEDLAVELGKDYTVAIVTHSMQQASRISDYTAFMYMGRLIEFNDTETMFSTPREEMTERYLTGRFGRYTWINSSRRWIR
ncbi:MAG: phosphate ABC transporter ATP-binding protein, partial [Candidatus Methanomethylophilaceae archaeon]|nr:phosphate ABC transporter ATP-binding protein [Candidatus Methanomethylophilaceae archaeon]